MRTVKSINSVVLAVSTATFLLATFAGVATVWVAPEWLENVISAALWYGLCTATISGGLAIILSIASSQPLSSATPPETKLQTAADLCAFLFVAAVVSIVIALVYAPFSITVEHAWLVSAIDFILYYGACTLALSGAAWCILKMVQPTRDVEASAPILEQWCHEGAD